MQFSVIVCTHNPRRDYLERTLHALRAQTLSKDQWELMLVDNASNEKLSDVWDLSWHPHARHIREEQLGLTPARLRGIRESDGEYLIFVDDDNVLASDYLETARTLTKSHSWVGAFGGNIVGEFEEPPEDWLVGQLHMLAIVSVQREEWSCGHGMQAFKSAPCGAGMVIRRNVAAYYAERVGNSPLRRPLDRKGSSLSSAGDSDMALCACALGYAVGHFPQLNLIHLISAERVKLKYILRLSEEMVCSYLLLQYIWDGSIPIEKTEPLCRSEKIFRQYKYFRNRLKNKNKINIQEELQKAWKRGESRAIELIMSHERASA